MEYRPYIYERQTEYWTSREIESYLFVAGHQVITFPLNQLTEKYLPADFIFFDSKNCKIFGLQYKALYHNEVDHWKLNKQQHIKMQHFDWIYYCGSELKDASHHSLALYSARFFKPTFDFTDKFPIKRKGGSPDIVYYRWYSFFEAFKECRLGRVVKSEDEFRELLQPIAFLNQELRMMIDIFLTDLKNKKVLHLSPLLCDKGNFEL